MPEIRFLSTPFSASKTLPCQPKWLMISAMASLYLVPGAMIAVPLAEPFGISPAGLARNRSSSSVLRHREQLVRVVGHGSLLAVSRCQESVSRRALARRGSHVAAGSHRRPFRRPCRPRSTMKKPGNARKHRGVDDAQAARAVHRERRCRAPPPSSLGADRARARRMVAPGGVAHVLGDRVRRCRPRLRARAPRRSGRLRSAAPSAAARSGSPSTTARRSSPARVAAFLEVVEVDERRVARIGRAQRAPSRRGCRCAPSGRPRSGSRLVRRSASRSPRSSPRIAPAAPCRRCPARARSAAERPISAIAAPFEAYMPARLVVPAPPERIAAREARAFERRARAGACDASRATS